MQTVNDDEPERGGGVCIYARNNLPVKKCSDLEIDGLEGVFIELKDSIQNLIIGCCYRPPGMNPRQVTTFLENFQNLLEASWKLGKTFKNSEKLWIPVGTLFEPLQSFWNLWEHNP